MVLNSKFKIPTARELFKSIPNARREWSMKTPMQKWCYLYGIGKVTLNLLRFPLFNEDISHVHWFAYFFFVYMFGTPILSLYTIWYYARHGSLEKSLPSTCITTMCLAYLPLGLVWATKQRFKLQSLMDFGGRHIYRDDPKDTEYNRLCSKHLDDMMRGHINKMTGITVSLYFCLIGPAHAYIVYGIKTTTTEMKMPFCEPKSNEEFIANLVLQIIIAVHAFSCYIGMEVFLTLFQNVVTITPQLVKIEINDAIRLYENKKISMAELHNRVKEIVKKSLDADDYVASLSNLLFWRNLSVPVVFTYCIAMAIFCQYTSDFAAGYGLAAMNWVQLFFICELGENIQDNGFADMLYETKWEDLPPKIQQIIMLLIHRKQNETGLKLGPFGVGINRETYKLLTNKVYTFLMFLMNFFD